eukprot:663718-Alexandrium_andersonii.AAC.1
MPNSPNPGATADANSRVAIGADLKGGRETEVLGNGSQPQTLCSPLRDTRQFRLAGAQSNGLLGGRPLLDGM